MSLVALEQVKVTSKQAKVPFTLGQVRQNFDLAKLLISKKVNSLTLPRAKPGLGLI